MLWNGLKNGEDESIMVVFVALTDEIGKSINGGPNHDSAGYQCWGRSVGQWRRIFGQRVLPHWMVLLYSHITSDGF